MTSPICRQCHQPASWTTRVYSDGGLLPGGRLGYEYCRLFYLDDDRYFTRSHASDNVWGCDQCKMFGVIDLRTKEQKAADRAEWDRIVAEANAARTEGRSFWRAQVPGKESRHD